MTKVFNRPVHINVSQDSALKVNGTEIIDKDGKLVADIKAPNGSIGTDELAADAVTGAKIADDAVSLEHLDAGIVPSHIVVLAGKLTMGGGNASEAETVTGLLATDIVVATITDNSANDDVSLLEAKPSTDTLTLLFNEDPGAGVVVDYVALRAAA